jgi:hypothetical protein
VVDVSVREDDKAERPNVEGERGPVLVVCVAPTLEQAAIDEKMCARRIDAEA